MRFISIYRHAARADHAPSQKMQQEMGKFMEECVRAGVLLATDGLGPTTARDLKVRHANGQYQVTDGPFTEAKEVIGGFAIMQCKTRDELLEWTRRFLAIAGDGECEIHQLADQSPLEFIKK